MKRVILIVLDSVGIGECPDSHVFGDHGVNTLGNIAKYTPGFSLPNMEAMGLGNIAGVHYLHTSKYPKGAFGRLQELSSGKDTTTGHWEIAGLNLKSPFPVYPDGFPKEIINAFEAKIGTQTLGNIPASGTAIIEQLGDEHIKTGFPIVYTSGDSVFQIAAHESIVPIERLYQMCAIAREILCGEHAVGRVIARPFEGVSGAYRRTERRKDFSLLPAGKTMLEILKDGGFLVKAVGKIEDIFSGIGITHTVHTKDNMAGVDKTLAYMQEKFEGLIFTNLVDFDMLYGHRRDVAGYAKALKAFDLRIPELLAALSPEDILMITADHGNDPTALGTDHTREYVPLLIYGEKIKSNISLGTRENFSDIAASILDYFHQPQTVCGKSFLKQILIEK